MGIIYSLIKLTDPHFFTLNRKMNPLVEKHAQFSLIDPQGCM